MEFNRRNFLRTTGITAFAGIAGIETVFSAMKKKTTKYSGKGLVFRFLPYDLQLRHTFTIANSSRNSTPDMLTSLEFEGVTAVSYTHLRAHETRHDLVCR